MGDTDKTREQLAEELNQAHKRIAELEIGRNDDIRTLPVGYDTFKAFFDSATDSFSIWDSNMNMVYINDVTLEKYYPVGTNKADIIGKHFTQLVPGSVESGRYERYLNVLKTGEPVFIDEFTPHPRFGDMYLSIKVFRIENGLGIITTDITERKRMEQKLRASQQRLSALIDNAPDIILSYDTNGRFLSGNRRASELLGYTLEEKIGTTFDESGLFTAESLVKAKQKIETYKQGKTTEPTPYELIAKDGSHLFVEVRGVPVVSGDEIEIIAIARDITERKKTEDALRHSEEKLRAILDSISDSITVIDANGNIADLNDAAVKLFGLKNKEEALGMNGLSFVTEEDQPSATSKLQKAVATRCVEYKFRRMDGSTFWGETSSDMLRDKSGDVTGFIGIVRDISERKKIEETLTQSEKLYRRLAENTPALICTFLPDSTLTYVNTAYCRYFNKNYNEIVGRGFLDFLRDDGQRQMVKEQYMTLTPENPSETHEQAMLCPDGNERWQQWTNQAFFDEEGKTTVFQSIGFDITERKKAEEALKESEEKFRIIFDTIADGISLIDLATGKLVDTNEAALRMFNFEREDVIGTDALELVAEKDRQRAMEDSINTLQNGDSGLGEWCLLGKVGKEHDCEARASIIYDRNRNPKYMVNVMRDIAERKRVYERLRESEEKLRRIFDSIGDGVSITDLEGNVLDVNEAALRLSGYSRDEFVGRFGLEMLVERDRPIAIQDMMETFNKGISEVKEYTALTKDGREFPAETRATVLRDASGDPVGLVSMLRDITERKRMQEALRLSEEKLRRVFDSIAEAVTIVDLNGIIQDSNETALLVSGYSREEHLGKYGLDMLAESDRALAVEKMAQTLERGYSDLEEFTVIRKDGSRFLAETITTVLYDAGGNPVGMVNILRDITERRRMQEELRQSEEKTRAIFESIADGITVSDLNGTVTDVNEAACNLSGYGKAEFIGKNGLDLVSECDRERATEKMFDVFETRLGTSIDLSLLKKDGSGYAAETNSSVLLDKSGQPTGLITVIRDITERKRIEKELNEHRKNLEGLVKKRTSELAGAYEELRESEGRLRAFFENVPDILFAHDMQGRFTDINDSSLELTGYSREEIVGKNILETGLIPPDQIDGIVEGMKALQLGGSQFPYEIQLVKKNGEKIFVEAVSFPVMSKGNVEVMGMARNITERKRMEEALRSSEEKLRTMFASMADGVVVTSLEGKVNDLNEAQLHLFGFSKKEEVIGMDGFDFIAEKDRGLAMNDMTSLFSEGIVTGRCWTFKRHKRGEFQAELSTALIYDTDGNPTDILVVMRDITERKRMEEALRESEEKLRTIFETMEDAICVIDMEGKVIDTNESALHIAGYTRKKDMIGIKGLDYIAEEDRERVTNDFINVINGGHGITSEYKLVNRHGSKYDIEVTGSIIRDASGKPSAIVNLIRDITERKLIEEALRESEEKYRTLVEQSEQGICIFQDGRVVFANNALSRMNGYTLREMYAMPPDDLLRTVHPDDREAFIERTKRRIQGRKLMPRHEYRTIRKDGAQRTLETYAKLITYNGRPAIQSMAADITERKQWEKKINESKEELKYYASQVTKAQEEERKRIARELHDDTIQELITLSRQLDDLTDKTISPGKDRRSERKKMELAQQQVAAILQGVRSFTRELRPSILDDLGLAPALEWLTSDLSERFGIPVNLSIMGTERKISPDAALTMFRVAQESLNNTGRHSGASEAQVNLKYTGKTVTLNVIDDGIGFAPPKHISSLAKHGKLGIAGMHERAQLIGADLSVKSKLGKGTTVTLDVPIEKTT